MIKGPPPASVKEIIFYVPVPIPAQDQFDSPICHVPSSSDLLLTLELLGS